MTAKNEHTGAYINSKAATEDYRQGYDRIFGKNKKADTTPPNSPIQGASVDAAKAFREMSDREWAALPANLREGCTVHVDGVGDL